MTDRCRDVFALAGALGLSLSGAVAAEPLTALFDACDRVLTDADYRGVAAYGLTKFEHQMAALVDVDEGRVSLSVAEWPDRGIHECVISGYDIRDFASAKTPGITVGQAVPIAETWFAGRTMADDAARIQDLFGGSIMIAICPGKDDRGGHFAATYLEPQFGDPSVAPQDRPMVFRIGRNAPDRDTPCEFKAATGQ